MRNRTTTMALAGMVAAALALSGCASAGNDATEVTEGASGTTESTGTEEATSTEESQGDDTAEGEYDERDVRGQSPETDHEQAVSAAVEAAGGGIVYEIELDHSDDAGEWVYEVSVLDGTTDHDITLSAASGEVLEHERDDEDDSEREVTFDDMTPAEALELAAAEVGADTVLEGWTLSWDDGRLHYDIDTDADDDDDLEVWVDDSSVTRD